MNKEKCKNYGNREDNTAVYGANDKNNENKITDNSKLDNIGTGKMPKLPPVPNRARTEMRADYPMTADDGYEGDDYEKM